MAHVVVERELAGRTFRIETGKVAKLATGAVMLTYAETTVLGTAMRGEPVKGQDWFPLQCDFREKTSAGGKFPGGFRKREGAPNEKEILTMRMMDRPIRPLFPDGFVDEIQLQCWVMSHDGQNDADMLACNAASAALHITDVPFEGPVATVRVGRVITEDGTPTLVLFPTHAQLEYSDLDLVLSGHKDGINMIEVGAAEVPDGDLLEAIRFGFEQGIQPLLELQEELRAKVGSPEKKIGQLHLPDPEVVARVKDLVGAELMQLRQLKGKAQRQDAIEALRDRMIEEHFAIPAGIAYSDHLAAEQRQRDAKEAFRRLEKKTAQRLVAEDRIRADGRALDVIRPLLMEVSILARTHGSALFQRGETQSIVTCTLGTGKDEQIVDGLMPEYAKKFYLHYNFPPFCTAETGRIMGPGRREIGHGALAERSLLGILPDPEEFPYTIRLVSDILESNGSSSMASVCGGCLALMDAGVPIKNTCAGISIGRFTRADGSVTHVTDIIGEEDFFGEMDFKVSGTREGITGIQLDLKARGLQVEEIAQVFAQAKKGRMDLIAAMEGVLAAPRPEISKYAPRLITIHIDPEKIGKLIGPGGKMIRGLQEKYAVQIDVEEDGTVVIASVDGPAGEQAKAEIEALCAEIKVGTVYTGKVVSTKEFGAFIEIAPGTDGMCHISELAQGYVKAVSDVVKIGDIVKVKVINIDENGRIKLSRKALLAEEGGAPPAAGQGGGPDQAGDRGHGGGHDRGHDRPRGDRARGGQDRSRGQDRRPERAGAPQ